MSNPEVKLPIPYTATVVHQSLGSHMCVGLRSLVMHLYYISAVQFAVQELYNRHKEHLNKPHY